MQSLKTIPKIAFPVGAAVRTGARVGKAALEGAKGSKYFGKPISRFAQRTLYSTTGWLPKFKKLSPEARIKKLREIKALQAPEGTEQAIKKTKEELGKKFEKTRILRRLPGTSKEKYISKHLSRQAAEREMAGKRLKTLPGVVKGLARHPLHTTRLGWKTMPGYEKAMLGGFTGMGAYGAATAPPGERLKEMGKTVGMAASWVPTGGLSIIPQIGAWTAAERAGGVLGGSVQKLVSKAPAAKLPHIPSARGVNIQMPRNLP